MRKTRRFHVHEEMVPVLFVATCQTVSQCWEPTAGDTNDIRSESVKPDIGVELG